MTSAPYQPAFRLTLSPPTVTARPSWAWAVALSPLIFLAGTAGVALTGVSGLAAAAAGGLIAWTWTVAAAVADTRSLRRAGQLRYGGIGAWALLFPWAYLLARAVGRRGRTGADWAVFGAGLALWLVAAVAVGTVSAAATAAVSPFHQAQEQSAIARSLQARTGLAVTVNCPADPLVYPGASIQCVTDWPGGSTNVVNLTIRDHGGYVWHLG
jgi:hypothetical protein